MLKYKRLISGGIITNYDCSSKCRHCGFASSPRWEKEYMTQSRADEIFAFLKGAGCHNVHIGGGEPLLIPERILPVLQSARSQGIRVEYIETNGSWHKDIAKTVAFLREMQDFNVDTLLISIDPFHNEYVPFWKIKGLMEACKNAGTGVFPWRMEFWGDLEAMGDEKPHSLEEFDKKLGPHYIQKLMGRYHLNMRGRALQTYKPYLKAYSLEEILKNSAPCKELDGIHHFHIDFLGNFIPELCAGLSISYSDLEEGVTAEKYPFLFALDVGGIKTLYELVAEKYGFVAKKEYVSKCDLCFDIRKHLVLDQKIDSPDLMPLGHYKHM